MEPGDREWGETMAFFTSDELIQGGFGAEDVRIAFDPWHVRSYPSRSRSRSRSSRSYQCGYADGYRDGIVKRPSAQWAITGVGTTVRQPN